MKCLPMLGDAGCVFVPFSQNIVGFRQNFGWTITSSEIEEKKIKFFVDNEKCIIFSNVKPYSIITFDKI